MIYSTGQDRVQQKLQRALKSISIIKELETKNPTASTKKRAK